MKKSFGIPRSTAWRILLSVILLAGAYTILGAVLFLRAGAYRTYDPQTDTRTYDLVIVFAGGSERIPPAFELLRTGKAKAIVVSPATQDNIDSWSAQYLDGGACTSILETKSTSTHDNAYYTAEIARREHARSIILITSFFHMTRSHRLLALALRGYPAEIVCYPAYPNDITDTAALEKIPLIRSEIKVERLNTAVNFLKFLADGLRIRKSGRIGHILERHYDSSVKGRLAPYQY